MTGARQSGFTLIELVIVIIVIGVGVAGLTLAMHTATVESVDPLFQQQSNAIAQSYMEEVMLKSFCDPDDFASAATCPTSCVSSACGAGCGTNQEASRDLYDNVCDYDGLVNNGAVDHTGSAITGLGDYTINVTVDDGSSGNFTFNGLSATSGEVVRIDVEVTHGASGAGAELTAYRVNY
jgi:MSHA pilin protein MshD